MAKKKGGKKGRGRDKHISESPQSTQDSAPETSEPALADAVSEVIGDRSRDGGQEKISKKARKQLAKFSADGHDVSPLEKIAETASQSELKSAMESFEKGIGVNRKIKAELQNLDMAGFESEAGELNALLSQPMQHEAASSMFASLVQKRRAKEMISTLDKMVLPSMKVKVEAFRARLADSMDPEKAEIEFSELKREYKEAYAEEGVKAQVVSASPEQRAESQRSRAPMMVKDLFLLYKDGRFISHHTNRVVSKEQQKELFGDLKTGRNFLRSPKYIPQKLNAIPVDGRYILVQSGRFTVVIAIVEGSVDPWSEKIVTKVLTLMESEDQVQLKEWNGDVASLRSSGKYMQALLFAFMKLSNKGKQ